jgi:DnaJ-class molecular chaperone
VVLGVTLPIAEGALKSAFRRKSLETHPDRDEGSNEDFIMVKEAYDFLIGTEMILRMLDEERDACTMDGTPLSNLGNGLPITKSGVKCEDCLGKGYNEQPIGTHTWKVCPHCNGKFKLTELPCKKCGGDGKFRRNGKVVGKCYQCNGGGTFKPKFPVTCKECNPLNKEGEFGKILADLHMHDPIIEHIIRSEWSRGGDWGWIGFGRSHKGMIPKFTTNYHVCHKCKGTGEIELFNPVLKRNRLG